MKIPGMNICSFDPYDNLNNPMNTKYSNGMLVGEYISFGTISQVTLDNAGAGAFSVSATTQSLTNFAIGNNPNRLLLVYVANYNNSAAPSTITYGAQNLTLLTTYTPASGNWSVAGVYVALYYLVAPTVSSVTSITVTFGSAIEYGIQAISYYNCLQSSSAFGTPGTNISATAPSVAITTTSTKSIVTACVFDNWSSKGTISATAPLTLQSKFNGDTQAVGDQTAATTGSYTSAWSVSGGTGHSMAEIAVEIKSY
jgi:hypothetical protein